VFKKRVNTLRDGSHTVKAKRTPLWKARFNGKGKRVPRSRPRPRMPAKTKAPVSQSVPPRVRLARQYSVGVCHWIRCHVGVTFVFLYIFAFFCFSNLLIVIDFHCVCALANGLPVRQHFSRIVTQNAPRQGHDDFLHALHILRPNIFFKILWSDLVGFSRITTLLDSRNSENLMI